MKIAVVGCGAVGSYYGAKLCLDGHEVHFLLRSDHDAVKSNGVRIISADGGFTVHPRCARNPDEIGQADLVIIGLKTTANDRFATLLPPLVSNSTAVLTLQNGLGNEEAIAKLFPEKLILGGLCFVCLNRTQPGVIHHMAHGKILMGEFGNRPQQRTHDIASMLQHAGIPCQVSDDLAQAHWEKLAWNIPFNGLGVASAAGVEAVTSGELESSSPLHPCLTTDRLLSDPQWREQVVGLMDEVIAAARRLGHPMPDNLQERLLKNTLEMGAYRSSSVVDFERGDCVEIESLFGEPLRCASSAGINMPRLARLYEVLKAIASRRNTGATG
ncbi:MAG TPA: 2-dehydropantoate 2-reductase [Roseimicrobium sp.]|nr:2-dehydropantoate 2-reductase [Roseimicrobium sp.]